MPIESTPNHNIQPQGDSAADAFIAESRQSLDSAQQKIVHCLNQLTDDDLYWRPFPSANSLQTIVLHLCGNVRQWIMHGVGGQADVRKRPQEFEDQQPLTKAELLGQLSKTVADADAVLSKFDNGRLTESRNVQGFDSNLLSVIYDCVSHFVGHTHQIVYITRLRVGDAYRFAWVPEGIDRAQAGE
jgi:uncharacterized damage-inducible protein DinB